MATVVSKCSNCGSSIVVDSNFETVTCSNCGAMYAVNKEMFPVEEAQAKPVAEIERVPQAKTKSQASPTDKSNPFKINREDVKGKNQVTFDINTSPLTGEKLDIPADSNLPERTFISGVDGADFDNEFGRTYSTGRRYISDSRNPREPRSLKDVQRHNKKIGIFIVLAVIATFAVAILRMILEQN